MNKMDKLKKFLNVKYLTLVALIVLILINVAQMLSKSNTINEQTSNTKQTTKRDYGGIDGTGIYSTLNELPEIDLTPTILEVLRDNTIKPDEKKDMSIKKCTEYITNYVKKHPKYLSLYNDYDDNKFKCDLRYDLTEIDFRKGLIK